MAEVPRPGEHTLWDPLRIWPAARSWIWALLGVSVCILQGPVFVANLRPHKTRGVDFFQEWASARNLLNGFPIYTPHEVSIKVYLGLDAQASDPGLIAVNAHPPASVLLGLPVAWLDYSEAVWLWNVTSLLALAVSLWLLIRGMGLQFSFLSIFPILTISMISWPLRLQVLQGQLNCVLLLLVTGIWAANRAERPRLAGALLGIATSIKLFPGFLFLHFALVRRWRLVWAGTVSLALITLLTAAVMGLGAYQDYITKVLPYTERFLAWRDNSSIAAFWSQLFQSGANYPGSAFAASFPGDALARACLLISDTFILVLWARYVSRSRPVRGGDGPYALSLITMLLLCPVVWIHYFILLIFPALRLLLAASNTRSDLQRFATFVVTATLLVGTYPLDFLLSHLGDCHPLIVTFALFCPCYALIGVFALALTERTSIRASDTSAQRLASR